MKRNPFDLFIFDEGGVMLRDFYVVPAMAERMGMPEKELIALLKPDLGDYSRGRLDGRGFWERFAARTGIVPAEDWFASLFNPSPMPGSFELVGELAQGCRVVCGTNTIDSHHEHNLSHDYYRGFHTVYASHLIGFAKPDTAFWKHILAAEKVEAARCFFVDDMQANIDAARSLGIHAFLFKEAESLRAHLAGIGVLESAEGNG